jgi:hypothetical protein
MSENRGVVQSEPPTEAHQGAVPNADGRQERAATMGRRLVDAVDRGREGVANQIDGAAHRAGQVSGVADRTADRLGSAAKYVRDHDTRDLLDQLAGLVRSHPGKSLLAVAALGFVTGRLLRRT